MDRKGESICTLKTDLFILSSLSFPLSFAPDVNFKSNSVSVSRKVEDVYPTGAPGPWSQFLVESVLLIYFCIFVRVILVISYPLLFISIISV